MTRLLPACIAAAAVLALPAGAAAKEAAKAKVCGAEGCTTQTSEQDRQAVVAAIENGGPPSSPPSRRVPFYRVSAYMRGAGPSNPFRLLVVPAARRVRGPEGTWFAMDRFAYRAWRRVTRDIRPFPAAQLPPRTYAPALRRPAASDGGGTAWALIGAIAAGTLALAAGATALVVRRRRREPPAARQTAPVS